MIILLHFGKQVEKRQILPHLSAYAVVFQLESSMYTVGKNIQATVWSKSTK